MEDIKVDSFVNITFTETEWEKFRKTVDEILMENISVTFDVYNGRVANVEGKD